MDNKNLKKLFDKYVRNECSDSEIEFLDGYLDSFQDKETFWSDLDYDEEVKEKLWSRISSEIVVTEAPVKRFNRVYLKYAAIFIGVILGSGVWYQMSTKSLVFENTDIIVNDSPVILKMANNTIARIDTDKTQVLADKSGNVVAKQKGNLISYSKDDQSKELVYNEVIVPDGKKFRIMLSDGTLVYMNSRSSLKYPANFVSNNEREVFLEGEAYFEVTKDSKRPFLVTTSEMGIKVLGTHFVVSSYKEDGNFVVLAEGSVAVYKGQDRETPRVIVPKEKATIKENNITVKKVDINDYLGWMDGTLTFNNEPFSVIVHKIERHYGVEIQNGYEAMNPIKFKGTFKDETITDLLDAFKESAGFDYEIRDNKIIINKK